MVTPDLLRPDHTTEAAAVRLSALHIDMGHSRVVFFCIKIFTSNQNIKLIVVGIRRLAPEAGWLVGWGWDHDSDPGP